MKNRKPWIALVSFPHPDRTRPYVIQNEELDAPATFSSRDAIEKLMMGHMLQQGVWFAFNYENGHMECLG